MAQSVLPMALNIDVKLQRSGSIAPFRHVLKRIIYKLLTSNAQVASALQKWGQAGPYLDNVLAAASLQNHGMKHQVLIVANIEENLQSQR